MARTTVYNGHSNTTSCEYSFLARLYFARSTGCEYPALTTSWPAGYSPPASWILSILSLYPSLRLSTYVSGSGSRSSSSSSSSSASTSISTLFVPALQDSSSQAQNSALISIASLLLYSVEFVSRHLSGQTKLAYQAAVWTKNQSTVDIAAQ